MSGVPRVGPVGVHVLDGSEDAVRVVGVVVAVDVLPHFHVEERFGYLEIGQQALVLVCNSKLIAMRFFGILRA